MIINGNSIVYDLKTHNNKDEFFYTRRSSKQSIEFEDISESDIKKVELDGNIFYVSGNVLLKAECSGKVERLPEGITEIGYYTVVFEYSNGRIEKERYGAFAYCDLKEIIIPKNVTKISERAFSECRNLQTINIPKNLTEIKKYTFHGCESLQSITLPKNLTEIEEGAFLDNNLSEITIPRGTTNIGKGAFRGCSKIILERFDSKIIKNLLNDEK